MTVYAGPKVPPGRVPKKGQSTKLRQSAGSKQETDERLQLGQAASQTGPAAAHRRLYARDYLKKGAAPGDTDLVTAALGNPLKI